MINKLKSNYKLIIMHSLLVILIILIQLDDFTNATKDNGCFHNGTIYGNGSIVPTLEPCLNCQCKNGNLICHLRMCPELPFPPPRGCVLVYSKEICCSHMKCQKYHSSKLSADMNRVGLALNTKRYVHDDNSSSEFRDDTSKIFKKYSDLNNSGKQDICIHNGTIYKSGSAMASSSLCKYCYCFGGKQKCIQPKCMLPPTQNCRPIFIEQSCCPIRYDCENDDHKDDVGDKEQRVKPTTIIKFNNFIHRNKHYLQKYYQLKRNRGCLIDSYFYPEGYKIPTNGENSCELCFCINTERKCIPKQCPTIIDQNCKPKFPIDKCCPASYDCDTSQDRQHSPRSIPTIDEAIREISIFKLLFGSDDEESTTIPSITNSSKSVQASPDNVITNQLTSTSASIITTTTEQPLLSALRYGLDILNNNEEEVENLLVKEQNEKNQTNNQQTTPTLSNEDKVLHFFDILLGNDQSSVNPSTISTTTEDTLSATMTSFDNADDELITSSQEENDDYSDDTTDFTNSTNPAFDDNIATKFLSTLFGFETTDYDSTTDFAEESNLNEQLNDKSNDIPNTITDKISTTNIPVTSTTTISSTKLSTTPVITTVTTNMPSRTTTTTGATSKISTNPKTTTISTTRTTTTTPRIVTTPTSSTTTTTTTTEFIPTSIECQENGTIYSTFASQKHTKIPITSAKPILLIKAATVTPSTLSSLSFTKTIITTSSSANENPTPPVKSPSPIKTTTSPNPTIKQSTTTTISPPTQNPISTKIMVINSNPSILESDINYDYSDPTLPPSLPNLKIIPFLPTDAVKNNRSPDINQFYKMPESIDRLHTIFRDSQSSIDSPISSKIDYNIYDDVDDDVISNGGDIINDNIDQSQHISGSSRHPDKNELYTGYETYNLNKNQAGAVSTDIDPNIYNKYGFTDETESLYDLEINKNNFSPPSKTEGGFVPKTPEPVDDSYYYKGLQTTNHPILYNKQQADSVKLNLNKLLIDSSTPDVFEDVIKTETAPELHELIEDKERQNLIKIQNEKTNVYQHNPSYENKFDLEKFTSHPVVNYYDKQHPVYKEETEISKTTALPASQPDTNDNESDNIFSSLFGFLFQNKVTPEVKTVESLPSRPVTTTIKPQTTSQRINNRIIDMSETMVIKPTVNSNTNLNILRDVLLENFSEPFNKINKPDVSISTPAGSSEIHDTKEYQNNYYQILSPLPPQPQPPPQSIVSDNFLNKISSSSIQDESLYGTNPIEIDTFNNSIKLPDVPIINSDPAGILKLAGCNIYGRVYSVGEFITELSSSCLRCECKDIGVHCTPISC